MGGDGSGYLEVPWGVHVKENGALVWNCGTDGKRMLIRNVADGINR